MSLNERLDERWKDFAPKSLQADPIAERMFKEGYKSCLRKEVDNKPPESKPTELPPMLLTKELADRVDAIWNECVEKEGWLKNCSDKELFSEGYLHGITDTNAWKVLRGIKRLLQDIELRYLKEI